MKTLEKKESSMEVDVRKDFIKLSIENFVSNNSLLNYFMYQGRIIGKTPDASRIFIDFIIAMEKHGVSGGEIVRYLSDRYFNVGE